MILVAIFEDNKHLRETFRFLLNNSHGFSCTGAYPDCSNIQEDITDNPCDVVLMDIEMPGVMVLINYKPLLLMRLTT